MEPIGLGIKDTGASLGGLSRATIYRLIGAGKLEALKIGARTIITTESIKALAKDAGRLAA